MHDTNHLETKIMCYVETFLHPFKHFWMPRKSSNKIPHGLETQQTVSAGKDWIYIHFLHIFEKLCNSFNPIMKQAASKVHLTNKGHIKIKK